MALAACRWNRYFPSFSLSTASPWVLNMYWHPAAQPANLSAVTSRRPTLSPKEPNYPKPCMVMDFHSSLFLSFSSFSFTLPLTFAFSVSAAYLNTGIILMNQGRFDEAKRTFLTCADIPDENLKDPHAHKSSVTSCLYNLGKLLHEQGHQEVSCGLKWQLQIL